MSPGPQKLDGVSLEKRHQRIGGRFLRDVLQETCCNGIVQRRIRTVQPQIHLVSEASQLIRRRVMPFVEELGELRKESVESERAIVIAMKIALRIPPPRELREYLQEHG